MSLLCKLTYSFAGIILLRFEKNADIHFYISKDLTEFEGIFLQINKWYGKNRKLSLIPIKYTKYILPRLNNLLFDITFGMYNNPNVILKIFSTIYLLCAVLFPSIPSERMPDFLLVTVGITSLGSTQLKKKPETVKKGQIPIAVS